MNAAQLSGFRRFACGLADEARIIAAQFRGNMNVSTKVDRSVVTNADHAIQQHICHAVKNLDPSHAVLCEEKADYLSDMPQPGDTEFCWVIDPLDGTRNYVRGLPSCCTSIALLMNGNPIVGVIGDMNSADIYSASIGQGLRLNELSVDSSPSRESGKPVVSFQPSHTLVDMDQLPAWTMRVRIRNFGSSAMHLAYVATGALDGAVCMDCRVWDFAAGYLLVIESGGRITCGGGKPLFPFDMNEDVNRGATFTAARPALHDQLIEPATIIDQSRA
ncbi:MAG: inositol monophosphatase [Phycisphaerae bacterium]|nr:MAG: inositol monophosphatase [Phycisphaerae bacterium]